MNLVVIPKRVDYLDTYIQMGISTFIFGLDKLSINYPTLTISEIKEIKDKYPNIDLFISINKTIYNKDLDYLKNIMNELNNIAIKGILFYDLAILEIYSKNKYHYDLVWHQTHMVTNYNTCNYYYKKNVKYGLVSSEITIEEIKEIQNNTKMKLFVFLIDYSIMAHSRRKLLSNYYISMNKEYDLKDKIISDKNNNYIVKENEDGTCILNGEMLNGTYFINDLKDANIEYGIINGTNISNELLDALVPMVKDIIDNGSKYSLKDIELLIGNNTGFFNKKTIFKVK